MVEGAAERRHTSLSACFTPCISCSPRMQSFAMLVIDEKLLCWVVSENFFFVLSHRSPRLTPC
jgi:hypothetical protein